MITQIVPTLDTHMAMQIFHAIWLVDEDGNHPAPYTLVSVQDVFDGRWRPNPEVVAALGLDEEYLRATSSTTCSGSRVAASTR